MARKKCSERGCDKGFIKDGLCWAHYTAKHGEQPFDHKKRPACAVEGCTRLSNKGEFCTRHAKNQQAPIAPVPVKSPRQAGTVATIPPPAAAVPETPAASSKRPAKQEEPPQDLVPVAFDGRDAELLVSLQEAADYNRRTLVAEILYRLDRSFDGQRFICVS